MRVFSTLLGLIIGLALLAGLFAGSYWLFKSAVGVFGTLEPQMATMTVIAAVIAVLCASIIAGAIKVAMPQGTYSSDYVDRADLYKQLLSRSIARLQSPMAMETDQHLIDLDQLLALHGSPKVISAYMAFCRTLAREGRQGHEVSALLNTLAKEMRGDLNRPALIFKENDLLDLLLRRY